MTLKSLGFSCFRRLTSPLGGDAITGREHEAPNHGLDKGKGQEDYDRVTPIAIERFHDSDVERRAKDGREA